MSWIFATGDELTPNGRIAANARARRLFVIGVLVGCVIGAVFDFIGYTPAQVSYRFDDSVPYSTEEVEDFIAEQIDTRPGDYCRVGFMRWDRYEARFGRRGTARYLSSPCRIYFRDWSYTSFGVDEKFRTILLHELLHAWGVGHSTNPASVMYPDYHPGQTLQIMDRFVLWIAKQRFEE